MKEVQNIELKELLLNTLIYFDDYCRKNCLTYYLFYGTLLGAIRHNGFIPWDDDVDVVMMRDDFERLVKLFVNNGRYKLVSIQNNKEYNLPLAKIIDTQTVCIQEYDRKEPVELGVYIDIFILDGVPAEQEKRERYMKKAVSITRSWGISALNFRKGREPVIKSIMRRIIYMPIYVCGVNHYLKSADKMAHNYKTNETGFVGNVSYATIVSEWWYYDDFKPIKWKFENHEFIVPEGYERILRNCYGDWRALPPEADRKPKHSNKIYWRN